MNDTPTPRHSSEQSAAAPAPPGRRTLKALLDDIRKMPMYRQLIPAEAGIGWPIPLRRNGRVYIIVPLIGFNRTDEKGKTALFPPFATITIDWRTMVPVEYLNLRYRNPWPEGDWETQAGQFPHPAVASMSSGEYRKQRKRLLDMLEKILCGLAENKPFTPAFKAEFGTRLGVLMEPALEPYYRKLAPKFFAHFLGSKGPAATSGVMGGHP